MTFLGATFLELSITYKYNFFRMSFTYIQTFFPDVGIDIHSTIFSKGNLRPLDLFDAQVKQTGFFLHNSTSV